MSGKFDTTRPRTVYTRPAFGPDPSPSEGVGDPSGDRFGGHFSLTADPKGVNVLWVYTDGAQPECTYSLGHLVPSGVTSGRGWYKVTMSTDAIIDDQLVNFATLYLGGPSGTPGELCALTRYLSLRWQSNQQGAGQAGTANGGGPSSG